MENRAHALITGLFTLLLSIGIVLVLIWFKHDVPNQNIFKLRTTRSISGLNKQATVKYRGIEVGKVTAITFNPSNPGEIIIQIDVDANTPITQDTYATLDYQGITGLAFVQLNAKGSTTALLVPNNAAPPVIELRPGLLDNVASRGEVILEQVEHLTRNMNQLLNQDNLKAVSASLNNFSEAAAGISESLKHINVAFDKVGKASDSVSQTMVPWRRTGKEVDALVRGLRKPNGAVVQLEQALTNLSGVLTDAKSVVAQIKLSTLPKINSTLEEASGTLQGINQAVESIGEKPTRILFDSPPEKGPGEPGFNFPKK